MYSAALCLLVHKWGNLWSQVHDGKAFLKMGISSIFQAPEGNIEPGEHLSENIAAVGGVRGMNAQNLAETGRTANSDILPNRVKYWSRAQGNQNPGWGQAAVNFPC